MNEESESPAHVRKYKLPTMPSSVSINFQKSLNNFTQHDFSELGMLI